jgi:hypothetical protein
MAICEKTIEESSVTVICTKSNYIYEPRNFIFKVYGSGIFCLFLQNLPEGVVPFVVMDSYF